MRKFLGKRKIFRVLTLPYNLKNEFVPQEHLFLDLNESLRETVNQNLPIFLNTSEDASEQSKICSSGLVQSSLMCIDVLARHLGTSFEWSTELTGTIAEIVTWSAQLMNSSLQNQALECMKLLGSAFICGGAVCGALGPRSLSHLSVFVS